MVPNDWKETTLEKVLTIGGGKDYKHLKRGAIPVYGSGGHMLSVSDYLYDGESVCIGRKGTIDKPMFLTGKFWTVDTLFYTHSFKDSEPYYIYQFFQTVPWRSLNEASGVPSLSKSVINKIKINLPPLPEQRKIAKILSTWDKAIITTERLIDNGKQQKKALMQQLLTGKKRLLDDSGKPFEGEWQRKLFKEVLRLDRGSSPRPIVNFITEDSDGVNWIKIGDTKNDTSYITSTKERISLEGAKKSRKVSVGEVIVSNSMSYGKPYILKIDGYIHDGWFVLRDYQEHIDSTFLIQLLSSEFVQAQYKRLAAGGVVTNISSELVYAVKVNLPQISEQRKIAAVLSNADKEIVLFEKQLADLKQEKKALMQQLLTGKRRVKPEIKEDL